MQKAALIIVATAMIGSPVQAWRVDIIETPAPVRSIQKKENWILIETGKGWWKTPISGLQGKWVAATAPVKPEIPPDALQDGRIVQSEALGARVYLAQPTAQYRHGVLGDAIEAEAVVIENKDGSREIIKAGGDAVFEDLIPRLADLDNDGIPEIMVVKSYLERGSALAVIGRGTSGKFQILDETPPIGTAHRWLNPAGVAAFHGTREREIALVKMPHALGRLEIWRWVGSRLRKIAEVSDVSNHSIGSRMLGLSAIADFNSDGVDDLAVPSFDRRSLRILAFKNGVRELARIELPAAITTDFILIEEPSDKTGLLLGLANGSLVRVRP